MSPSSVKQGRKAAACIYRYARFPGVSWRPEEGKQALARHEYALPESASWTLVCV